MTKQIEALKLSRDEIAGLNGDPYYSGRFEDVLQKIDEALAKPEQEPVAWIEHHKGGDNLNWEEVNHPYAKATPLYTSPQQRKPLTRDQVKEMMVENGYDQASPQERADFINGIRHGEAAHGIAPQGSDK